MVLLVGMVMADVSGAPMDQWMYQTSGIAYANFNGVAYGGGKFVVAGSAGSSAGLLMSSEDGVAWTERTYGSTRPIVGIAHGDGTFVAIGWSGTVAVSTNGENWASFSLSNTTALNLNAITYGNERFVIVGDFLGGGSRRATSYASTDALTWTNWLAETNSRLRDVAFGGGRFVAAADNSYTRYDSDRTLLVSSNGMDWEPRGTPPFVDVAAITYGNGQFVALARHGSTNAMLTSPDGESWLAHPLTLGNNYVARMRFGNGMYFAVGSSNQSRHTMLYSTNGADWQAKYIGPYRGNYFLDDLAFGNGRFVVVGMPNTIAQSGSFTRPWFERVGRRDEDAEFEIGGEVGRGYRLQYSSDLRRWEDLVAYTNTLPVMRVIGGAEAEDGRRFYRAVTE